MKTVTVYKKDGSEAGTIDLPQDIFGIEPSAAAIYQVVKAHLANRRQGTASSKTRSEVKLSKQKMFRQKGTGRARAGSANSPVWVGGGVAFGPKPRSYNQKINRKLKKLAMKSAYSIKAQEDKIKIVEDFSLEEIKTRNVDDMLKALGITEGKTMFVLSNNDENLLKSSKNIPGLNLAVAENTNTYEVMNSDVLIFAKTAVEKVKEYFAN